MSKIELLGCSEDSGIQRTPIDDRYCVALDYHFLMQQSSARITTVVDTNGYLIRLNSIHPSVGHVFLGLEGKWYLVPSSYDYTTVHPHARIHDKLTLGPFDTVQEPLTIYVYLSSEPT